MSYYIHQGSRNDRDENYPGNPFDRDETPGAVIVCEECGGEVFDPKEYAGNWCDRCLVKFSNASGDWDKESIAARERLNRN